MFKEFRNFAMSGNVVDLAIGVIIGAAFGAIVSSLVNDIIMPIIGFASGGMDFSSFVYTLAPARLGPDGAEIAAVTINYGKFINYVLTFVKGMNQMRKAETAAPDAPPELSAEEKLLTEIRDLIRAKM